MPDVLTHILFANMVKESISDINVKDAIENNLQTFYFGAQGPDFLYYLISPLLVDRRVPAAGSMMHRIETARFFKDYVLWLENLEGIEYEQCLAYFAGFLTHFYCDKTIHPYIIATKEQGADYFKKRPEKARLSHYMIEYIMDIRLWKQETGEDAYKQNIIQLIGEQPLSFEISRFITEFINATQPNVVRQNEVYNSSVSMRKIHRILYDPNNTKKWFINLFPLPRKCYVKEAKVDVDVLNINKRTWHYTLNEEEISDSSVYDLMEIGSKECVKCLDEISEMLEKGIAKDLDRLIPNVSYLTNKPI